MIKSSDLALHLKELNPDKTTVRRALFQFLSFLTLPDAPVTPQLINQFYALLLRFPFWQQNRENLSIETHQLLKNYFASHQIPFEWNQLQLPQNTQIISIEHPHDLKGIIENYLSSISSANEKIKVIPIDALHFIGIQLKIDRSLTLTSFNQLTTINEGYLEPLFPHFQLHYTPFLELCPKKTQMIELSPHIFCQFEVRPSGCVGNFFRGYTLHNFSDIKNQKIHQVPELFYSIKKLERFFIDPHTDPLYTELLSLIEKSMEDIKTNKSLKLSEQTLQRAKNALQEIYVDDPLLTQYVRGLESTIIAKTFQTPTEKDLYENPS